MVFEVPKSPWVSILSHGHGLIWDDLGWPHVRKPPFRGMNIGKRSTFVLGPLMENTDILRRQQCQANWFADPDMRLWRLGCQMGSNTVQTEVKSLPRTEVHVSIAPLKFPYISSNNWLQIKNLKFTAKWHLMWVMKYLSFPTGIYSTCCWWSCRWSTSWSSDFSRTAPASRRWNSWRHCALCASSASSASSGNSPNWRWWSQQLGGA